MYYRKVLGFRPKTIPAIRCLTEIFKLIDQNLSVGVTLAAGPASARRRLPAARHCQLWFKRTDSLTKQVCPRFTNQKVNWFTVWSRLRELPGIHFTLSSPESCVPQQGIYVLNCFVFGSLHRAKTSSDYVRSRTTT